MKNTLSYIHSTFTTFAILIRIPQHKPFIMKADVYERVTSDVY